MRRGDGDVDEEEDGDEDAQVEDVAEAVRGRVTAALPRAIAEVERVVLHGQKFPSDDVRHACVALLRVAPKLLARDRRDPPGDDSWLGYSARNTPERAAMLLRRIQREEARAARGEGDNSDFKPLDD